uniref:Uncharacterized protein n=1 Tax=Arundo donax TaxID=35708 RepID=A0A0A9EQ22_ARUDO
MQLVQGMHGKDMMLMNADKCNHPQRDSHLQKQKTRTKRWTFHTHQNHKK